MSGTDEDDLTRARTELGEPDALFQVSPAVVRAKLAIGLALLVGGLALNVWWWGFGPQRFEHYVLHFLIWPPAVGAALLVHMYRQRGLVVLVYPTGLLRLRRGEVESFPWAEVAEVRVKVKRADSAEILRDDAGNPTACWLPADVPAVQVWNGGLTVRGADAAEAHFGPALADYARLAEEVQRRTFPFLWADVWGRFRDDRMVAFGDIEANRLGLHHAGKLLAWHEVKEVVVAQGKLTVKAVGRWLPWAVKDGGTVPNPHVLFALVGEARRAAPAKVPADQIADDDANGDDS